MLFEASAKALGDGLLNHIIEIILDLYDGGLIYPRDMCRQWNNYTVRVAPVTAASANTSVAIHRAERERERGDLPLRPLLLPTNVYNEPLTMRSSHGAMKRRCLRSWINLQPVCSRSANSALICDRPIEVSMPQIIEKLSDRRGSRKDITRRLVAL